MLLALLSLAVLTWTQYSKHWLAATCGGPHCREGGAASEPPRRGHPYRRVRGSHIEHRVIETSASVPDRGAGGPTRPAWWAGAERTGGARETRHIGAAASERRRRLDWQRRREAASGTQAWARPWSDGQILSAWTDTARPGRPFGTVGRGGVCQPAWV